MKKMLSEKAKCTLSLCLWNEYYKDTHGDMKLPSIVSLLKICKRLWLHFQATPPCQQQGATKAHRNKKDVNSNTEYILHSPPVPCLFNSRPTVLLSGLVRFFFEWLEWYMYILGENKQTELHSLSKQWIFRESAHV